MHAVEQSYINAPDFYAPENYVTQVEKELLPTLEELAPGKQLLDLYAGQGREAEIFAEAGYNVVCVDRVAESVELGRKRAASKPFKATFLVADIENPTWQPPAEKWDVVYTSLWMLSTTPNREHRALWLEHLRSFGDDSSLFVVSATLRRNKKLASLRHVWTRILRVLSFNSRQIEFGDYFSSGIFWHEFLDEEVRDEINAAGFEILADYESHDKNVPTCNFYFLRRRHGAE
ncbi:MAG: class I SAM-dependent methyltransferase [Planctomycetota bacterium]